MSTDIFYHFPLFSSPCVMFFLVFPLQGVHCTPSRTFFRTLAPYPPFRSETIFLSGGRPPLQSSSNASPLRGDPDCINRYRSKSRSLLPSLANPILSLGHYEEDPFSGDFFFPLIHNMSGSSPLKLPPPQTRADPPGSLFSEDLLTFPSFVMNSDNPQFPR